MFLCPNCSTDNDATVVVAECDLGAISSRELAELKAAGFDDGYIARVAATVIPPTYRWSATCACGVTTVARTGESSRPSRVRSVWDDDLSGVCPFCGDRLDRVTTCDEGAIRWLGEHDECDSASFWTLTR